MKNLPKTVSRIFLVALIANSVLVVLLLALGVLIHRSGESAMHDMGRITLEAFRAARPILWGSMGLNSPETHDFVKQLADQKIVKNFFVYTTKGKLVFSYSDPNPDDILTEPPTEHILKDNTMFMYDTYSFGNHRHGGGMMGGRTDETLIICLALDTSTLRSTNQLRNYAITIAILMEIIMLLLYTKVSRMIKEYERSRTRLQLAEQEAATGRLAAILAHEIKNPLSSIKGLVGYSIKKSSDESVVENLDRSITEIDRLAAIVNGFLTFGKPIDLEISTFKIRECCEKATTLLSHDLIHTKKAITINGTDFEVNADYNKLLQILVNLILNALDASPAGGTVSINIGAKQLSIINSVTDGAKIDTSRIFEPFYTTKAKGGGLGLPIAKKILELHNFKIEITNTDPFTLILILDGDEHA
ncbi:MAG: hypothetical protein LBV09_06415 [Deferribacteraceae bacterium]|jgi:two-component system sensor histidine kinase HydH|nr:hypothetical protein [Deferribacteraceae bacterium]